MPLVLSFFLALLLALSAPIAADAAKPAKPGKPDAAKPGKPTVQDRKDRPVALQVIARHQALSNKYVGFLQENPDASAVMSEKATCINDELAAIPENALSEEDALTLLFSTFDLYSDSLDVLPTSGGDSPAAYQKMLRQKARVLLANKKASARAKTIARGLLGHANVLQSFSAAPELNLCQALVDWKDSAYDNSVLMPTVSPYVEALLADEQFISGIEQIDSAATAMSSIKPPLPQARVGSFQEVVMFKALSPMLFSDSSRAISLLSAGR